MRAQKKESLERRKLITKYQIAFTKSTEKISKKYTILVLEKRFQQQETCYLYALFEFAYSSSVRKVWQEDKRYCVGYILMEKY